MSDFAASMALPFTACLLLAGIHVYLGIHVIARKVIFVDLALAQIAALGAVYGMLLGYRPEDSPWEVEGFSLLFATLGALVFAVTRPRRERVPHEAIIGVTYATALAVTILAGALLPHGLEEVNSLLQGNILWVRADTLVRTAILYGAVGVLHFLFRRRFLLISFHPEEAERANLPIRAWDFLFYLTFAFVVTSSVAIAGVLLVFTYLVIPALLATLFAESVRARLAIGWILGTTISFAGVWLSYAGDLPSGPTIVASFTAALVAGGVVHALRRSAQRARTALGLGALAAAIALPIAGSWYLLKPQDIHELEAILHHAEPAVRRQALGEVERDPARRDARHILKALLADPEGELRAAAVRIVHSQRPDLMSEVYSMIGDTDDRVREAVIEVIQSGADPEGRAALASALGEERDDYLAATMAEVLWKLGDLAGAVRLVSIMDTSPIEQARRYAYELFTRRAAASLPFDPAPAAGVNDAQIEPFLRWLDEQVPPARPR